MRSSIPGSILFPAVVNSKEFTGYKDLWEMEVRLPCSKRWGGGGGGVGGWGLGWGWGWGVGVGVGGGGWGVGGVGVGVGGSHTGYGPGCAAPRSEPLPYFRESQTPKTYPIYFREISQSRASKAVRTPKTYHILGKFDKITNVLFERYIIQTCMDGIYKHVFRVCTIWDAQSF